MERIRTGFAARIGMIIRGIGTIQTIFITRMQSRLNTLKGNM
jgi:hypothetical protein